MGVNARQNQIGRSRQKQPLLDKCVGTIRQEGVGRFCAKAAGRLAEFACTTNSAYWYCCDLSHRHRTLCPPVGVTVDYHAWKDTCDWLRQLRQAFRWVYIDDELLTAERYGHTYPLMRVGAEKAGYIKVGFGAAYVCDFDANLILPKRSAFIYDTFVHPRYRGHGLATFMISRVLGYLNNCGFEQAWCHIPPWNEASAKAFHRNGFVRTKYIRHVRLFGWRLYTRNPEKLMWRHCPK